MNEAPFNLFLFDVIKKKHVDTVGKHYFNILSDQSLQITHTVAICGLNIQIFAYMWKFN